MVTSDRAQVFVYDISAELKTAISKRVREGKSNMNDVTVAILAGEFNVKFTPNGTVSSGLKTGSGNMVLYMPRKLHLKLKLRALHESRSVSGLVKELLANELLKKGRRK